MSSDPPNVEQAILDATRLRRRPPRSLTWLGDIYPDQAAAVQPLRFRLGELFAVITVASVLLALFRALGVFGAILSFAAAVTFTNFLYPRLRPQHDQETMFDFVWGIIMPLVCLGFDPFVFKLDQDLARAGMEFMPSYQPSFSDDRLHSWAIPAYAFIGWQLLGLGVWLFVGRLPEPLSAVWSGMLWTGFVFSTLVGVFLFLPSVFGIVAMGYGMLGFTPLFTARAFFRRAQYAGIIGAHAPNRDKLSFVGFCLAFPLPILGVLAAW